MKTLQRMRLPGVSENSLREETDSEMEQRFHEEVALLFLFGSSSHPHIVALLTAFVHAGKFRLVFPSADCDLIAYWERSLSSTMNLRTIRWVAKQLYGLGEQTYFGSKPCPHPACLAYCPPPLETRANLTITASHDLCA